MSWTEYVSPARQPLPNAWAEALTPIVMILGREPLGEVLTGHRQGHESVAPAMVSVPL